MDESRQANDPETTLSPIAQQVLRLLREQAQPMDSIGISSVTRLPVEAILQAVRELTDAGLVERAEPEPVHERFAVPA
jgi:predicted transcriptional regulator